MYCERLISWLPRVCSHDELLGTSTTQWEKSIDVSFTSASAFAGTEASSNSSSSIYPVLLCITWLCQVHPNRALVVCWIPSAISFNLRHANNFLRAYCKLHVSALHRTSNSWKRVWHLASIPGWPVLLNTHVQYVYGRIHKSSKQGRILFEGGLYLRKYSTLD